MPGRDDLPLGLREQLDGVQAGSPQGILLCDWCKRQIVSGEEVSMFAYRAPDSPWHAAGYSCSECGDEAVGIPTMGMDEVMVRVHVVKKPAYKKKLWVDFDGAEMLDHQPPTSGSKATPEEAEEWMGSSSPPTQ